MAALPVVQTPPVCQQSLNLGTPAPTPKHFWSGGFSDSGNLTTPFAERPWRQWGPKCVANPEIQLEDEVRMKGTLNRVD